MAKFITLHNKTDGKEVDINMDMLESFSIAKDAQGGTKLYIEETAENKQYWRVEETPAQIRAMLKIADSNVVNEERPWPMRYTFEGVEVSETEIIEALRLVRSINFKALLGQEYIDWIRSVFRTHSDPRPGSYDVGANQAIEIAEIIKLATLRRLRKD